MRKGRNFILGLLAMLVLPFGISLAQDPPAEKAEKRQTWRNAPRHSSGVAPDPAANADIAIVQVMAAHTYGWRGYFAVHPWIIYKRAGETSYTRYDVVGWGGGNVVRKNYALPDGLWFGSEPQILADHRGEGVDDLIDQIEAAIETYPYPDQYRSYPGPNSNTFVAHIGRKVPDLDLDMPANAIGKDFRAITDPVGLSPSGQGVQANLLGLFGFSIGLEEGIELNLLGLNIGIDFNRPALRLPSVGRLGMDNVAPVGDVEPVEAADAGDAGVPAY
ncbi:MULTISPECIES: DUF3750 domain-containing protein [Thalassospira]|uniref:DUF3750 domain-containing protein n=1 Tax=Thalassospira TaxID=168934 RepID=UPI001FFF1072|nr:DUF3750 domain-containing protein [Thalassospira lucentensis]MCK2166329.1 DUF3750 domain-containing protein [Thalassospira xiamenensis]WOI09591.1 DUF3750 domain-containing protein [Thalassospira lucentensis]